MSCSNALSSSIIPNDIKFGNNPNTTKMIIPPSSNIPCCMFSLRDQDELFIFIKTIISRNPLNKKPNIPSRTPKLVTRLISDKLSKSALLNGNAGSKGNPASEK